MCPSNGSACALRMRGCALVGPGPINNREGTCKNNICFMLWSSGMCFNRHGLTGPRQKLLLLLQLLCCYNSIRARFKKQHALQLCRYGRYAGQLKCSSAGTVTLLRANALACLTPAGTQDQPAVTLACTAAMLCPKTPSLHQFRCLSAQVQLIAS